MEKDYKEIWNAAIEFKNFTLKDFMEARTLVNSRLFGIKVNNVDDDWVVPMADMFNYSHIISHTSWKFNPTTNRF